MEKAISVNIQILFIVVLGKGLLLLMSNRAYNFRINFS